MDTETRSTVEKSLAGVRERRRVSAGFAVVRRTCGRLWATSGPFIPFTRSWARCVGRQLRMRSALSDRDEGGICTNTFLGPRGRREFTARERTAQCRLARATFPISEKCHFRRPGFSRYCSLGKIPSAVVRSTIQLLCELLKRMRVPFLGGPVSVPSVLSRAISLIRPRITRMV